jgi:cobalt-precorrin 5A hydrolase
MDNFGIKGVCEPSSLISAGEDSTLIFRKTSYNGVTVAIAVS